VMPMGTGRRSAGISRTMSARTCAGLRGGDGSRWEAGQQRDGQPGSQATAHAGTRRNDQKPMSRRWT
jgi:hypothetical protein